MICAMKKKQIQIMMYQVGSFYGHSCQYSYIIQMYNNSQIFKSFLENVSKCNTILESLKEAQANYHIRPYQICKLNSANALKLYDSIHLKFYRKDNHSMSCNWYENELRLFVWVVFCYVHLKGIQIQQLGHEDWDYFSSIFNYKDPKLFQYQCHCLYLENKGKNWQLQQENLLKDIIQRNLGGNERSKGPKVKWHQISKHLFHQSGKKYLRTPKQCRERWNNHLDPSKVKGMWKRQQCLTMFEYVQKHGKKWAKIVDLLDNCRNEHSIKNKFNSLLKKQAKSNKNMSEQQMYGEIIMRIKSAIANQKFTKKNHNIDFDLNDEEQIQFARKSATEQQKNKPSNFAQKLMHKLMNFGVKSQTKAKQTNNQNSQTKVSLKTQKDETEKQSQKISFSQNQSLQNQDEEELEEQENIDQQQGSQDRLGEMNRFEKQEDLAESLNKKHSSFSQQSNELNSQIKGELYKENDIDYKQKNEQYQKGVNGKITHVPNLLKFFF